LRVAAHLTEERDPIVEGPFLELRSARLVVTRATLARAA
jgi:hypothetical protein